MADLLKHQIEDSKKFSTQNHGLNFSRPGTGKTLTDLALHAQLGAESQVVVAPGIALGMWKENICSYFDLADHEVQILRRGKDMLEGNPKAVITTYGLAASSQYEQLAMYMADNRDGGVKMTLDESHYAKNRTAKRTKAIFGPSCGGRGGLFDFADRVDELTGTPVVRYADDLWAQLRATRANELRDWGVLSFDAFVRQFCWVELKKFHKHGRMQRVVTRNKNEPLLHEFLYDVCGAARRTIDEVADMPPLTERTIDIETVPNQELAKYARMDLQRLETLMGSDGDELATARRLLGVAKSPAMGEYIVEQAMNGPVLVGFWHKEVASALAKVAVNSGVPCAVVDGTTPDHQAEQVRLAFNNNELPILFGQMAKMGVAWNLQEQSRHVMIAEDHFSPGVVEQFIKRVYRMGQKQHVQLDWLKASHNLDRAITNVRKRKEASNELILD